MTKAEKKAAYESADATVSVLEAQLRAAKEIRTLALLASLEDKS